MKDSWPSLTHFRGRSRWIYLVGGMSLGLALSLGLWRGDRLRPSEVQCQIAGPSMAESLWGPHLEVTCLDCRFAFRCGAEYLPEDRMLVCPNCGFSEIRAVGPLQPGRLVRIGALESDVGRWESVALQRDGAGAQRRLEVKRVVGLGGERVAIRDGDLYANGRILRKTLRQLRAMAILVHDSDYRPRDSSLPRRWRSISVDGGWSFEDETYRYRQPSATHPDDPQAEPEWLVYRNWPCLANPAPPHGRTDTVPVWDHYGYNQDLSRGPLHRVADLMLSCRVRWRGTGTLLVRLRDTSHEFVLDLNLADGTISLSGNGRMLSQSRWPIKTTESEMLLEAAVCDLSVLLAIDGRDVLRYEYAKQRLSAPPSTRRLAIAARGLELEARRLQVSRDLHYLGPTPLDTHWQWTDRLGGDELLVLGDNVPVSTDSRSWHPAAVHRSAVLGRILPN